MPKPLERLSPGPVSEAGDGVTWPLGSGNGPEAEGSGSTCIFCSWIGRSWR